MKITKTTKRATAILESAAAIMCHSEASYFRGEPLTDQPGTSVEGKWTVMSQAEYLKHELASRSSYLRDNGNGHYTLHVHGNLWYEFTSNA